MAGIILTNAYNHYLTSYASKRVTQADSHKKDDLRSVYKSILKSSLKNPVLLNIKNDNAEEKAIDLKENAGILQRKLLSLGEFSESSISTKAAFSSDSDAVSAAYIGHGAEDPPSLSIKVEELAKEQINKGKALPDEDVKLAPSSYSFNIRVRDQVYELQYAIKPSDTNKDIQERLCRLINKAAIGLRARVETDTEGNTSLDIRSETTGLAANKDSQFSISEEFSSGNKGTVAYFGLDNIDQNASNAMFVINGSRRHSASNHFTVSKTYELNLNNTTPDDQEVTVGIKNSQESLIDHVHSLVRGYNSFLDSINGVSSDHVKTGKIISETIRAAKKALNDDIAVPTGISVSESGKLTIDETQLREAAETDFEELESIMAPVRAFVKALDGISKNIAVDPMQYIDRPVVAYKNPSGNAYPNPYMLGEYAGMLFNSYC